jgi:hypothetical protein
MRFVATEPHLAEAATAAFRRRELRAWRRRPPDCAGLISIANPRQCRAPVRRGRSSRHWASRAATDRRLSLSHSPCRHCMPQLRQNRTCSLIDTCHHAAIRDCRGRPAAGPRERFPCAATDVGTAIVCPWQGIRGSSSVDGPRLDNCSARPMPNYSAMQRGQTVTSTKRLGIRWMNRPEVGVRL